ncbi:hypothetical protein STEG23_014062, partial [Scotinomys teguina]
FITDIVKLTMKNSHHKRSNWYILSVTKNCLKWELRMDIHHGVIKMIELYNVYNLLSSEYGKKHTGKKLYQLQRNTE